MMAMLRICMAVHTKGPVVFWGQAARRNSLRVCLGGRYIRRVEGRYKKRLLRRNEVFGYPSGAGNDPDFRGDALPVARPGADILPPLPELADEQHRRSALRPPEQRHQQPV